MVIASPQSYCVYVWVGLSWDNCNSTIARTRCNACWIVYIMYVCMFGGETKTLMKTWDRDGGENMSIYSTFPYRWMILLNDVALFYVVAVTDGYSWLGYCCYWCWFDSCSCCCCCCRSSNAKWKKKLHFEMKNEEKLNKFWVRCLHLHIYALKSFVFIFTLLS